MNSLILYILKKKRLSNTDCDELVNATNNIANYSIKKKLLQFVVLYSNGLIKGGERRVLIDELERHLTNISQ